MGIIVDGERSLAWLAFAKNKLAALRSVLDIVNSRIVVRGYQFALFAMGDTTKIKITAPPGAVVCSESGGEYQYRYADQYGGGFATTMSRAPAEGFSPRALFSGTGELMYHGTSDYSAVQDKHGTLAASWYSPRVKLPSDPSDPAGYLAGSFVVPAVDPAITPTAGYAFTRNKLLYAMSAVRTTTLKWFTDADLTVVRDGLRFSTAMSFMVAYSNFKGRAFFVRPVWGEDGAIVYVFHNGILSDCGTPAGASRVMAYYQEVVTDPFGAGGFYDLGGVTQNAISTALGTAPPCDGGSTQMDTATAMTALLGASWPVPYAPYERGMFSCDDYNVCCWGPVPAGGIKGVVFSFDGSVEVRTIALPAYNAATEQPVITEVSPGHYVCEVWNMASYTVSSVHYGSPFTGWTALAHPPGTIVRHRTVAATTDRHVALAIINSDGATTLHEYDSQRAEPWQSRGKICDGEVGRADVAVFGSHKYAHQAALDSPVRGLWL
jgi:hypothetical protein